jgi:hypothetical protein
MSHPLHPFQALRKPRLIGSAALALGAMTALAACGSSSTGSATASKAGTPTGDQVTAITSIASDSGSSTSVALDAGTVKALTGLGVALKPTGTATVANGSITFPITSGYAEIHSDHSVKPGWIQGSIQHDGSGFTLSAGSKSLALSNFVVDPGDSVLYGTVGGTTANVPLLTLDGTNVKASMPTGEVVLDGTVAKLTDTAAQAIDTTFGTTAVTAGLPLGVVHLVASTANVHPYAASSATAIPRLGGVSTNVAVDAGTLKALTGLGVKVSTEGTATLTAGTLSFPITGGMAVIHSDKSYQPGYITGAIPHEGSGVTFSAGKKSLTVENFVVDPGSSMLYAQVGGTSTEVPLLFLDGTNVKISQPTGEVVLDGTVAKLTQTAADALDKTFGTTAVTAGLPLGVVHLVAKPQS